MQIAEELVASSGSASNMAILLLPLILALVPLGLFQDVSLTMALLYTLATDIVSVLPVALKGIELLSGDTSKHSTVSYVYGKPGKENFAVAETWAAACRQDEGFREKGIALLFTALAAMVIGIILEIVARAQVSKYKIEQKRDYARVHEIPPPYEGGGLLWHMNKCAYDKSWRMSTMQSKKKAFFLGACGVLFFCWTNKIDCMCNTSLVDFDAEHSNKSYKSFTSISRIAIIK